MDTIWLAFLTGLTTGGISCFAIQGGLLASTLANDDKTSKSKKILFFLTSKLIAYSLLGGLLGLFGSILNISLKLQAFLQLFAGLYLLATAARMLNLHPIFRRTVIQTPAFMYKFIKKESALGNYLAPILLGFLTVLLPCGVTQAMMVLSISSGDLLTGAGILFAFTLGTSPVFFLMGAASAELLKRKFLNYIATAIIIVLGIISINSALSLLAPRLSLQYLYRQVVGYSQDETAEIINGKQYVKIFVRGNGYKKEVNTLKAGIPVEITLVTNNTYSCARSFTIPEYNIVKQLPVTGETRVEIIPQQPGEIYFTCSMGMYTGYFTVK